MFKVGGPNLIEIQNILVIQADRIYSQEHFLHFPLARRLYGAREVRQGSPLRSAR